MENFNIFLVSWDLPVLNHREVVIFMDCNGSLIGHNVFFQWRQSWGNSSFIIFSVQRNLEIVEAFPYINWEVWLVCFKADAISNLGAKHHLWATHKVVHHVLELWVKSLLINHIKVNFFVCGNLDSNVSLNEVNLSAHFWDLVVLFPEASFFVNLEEENRAGGSDDESLVEKQVHSSQIGVGNLLGRARLWILCINGEAMTLSIESMAVSSHSTIERFDWEVQRCTVLDLADSGITQHFLVLERVIEMILLLFKSVIDTYE